MAVFTITGDVDPFLHVSLRKGERIYCESDAMVMMEDTLDLSGRMTGGLMSALMRRFANGESFFQQHIEAVRGDGDCLLSPVLPGALQVLEVGATCYLISDGAFMAAESGVDLRARAQNIGNALFAQTGGFFIGEATGNGKLVVSGFGSSFILEVTPGRDVVIDNAHVVAWDSRLHYQISVPNQGSQSSGLIGRLIHSATSGEGVVLRFSGQGKVVISSRNRNAFMRWIGAGVGGSHA
jgi:uncharacterized protein (TIGR00266 family)